MPVWTTAPSVTQLNFQGRHFSRMLVDVVPIEAITDFELSNLRMVRMR